MEYTRSKDLIFLGLQLHQRMEAETYYGRIFWADRNAQEISALYLLILVLAYITI